MFDVSVRCSLHYVVINDIKYIKYIAVDPEVTLKCRSTGDKPDETTIYRVLWNDLITPLKCLRPTGPGGHGRGSRGQGHLGMCGGKLPNQLVTSPESLKFIEDSHERITKAEQVKEEKAQFCKKAYADKTEKREVSKTQSQEIVAQIDT